jgi:KDO2-lipid IV(A) lauroyltransferase
VAIEGLEHLAAAQARSKTGGVLVLTAHFGAGELVGAAMARRGHPLCVIHHAFDNPYVDAWVARWRDDAGMETLELGSAGLAVMRALGSGRVVAVLLDQNAGRDEGIFAPFFSELASTRSGPATLAASRDIPVVPVFCFRCEDDAGHVVRFARELAIEPTGEDAESALRRNVTRMNQAIESAITSAPDQWLWAHKRWKTRPHGEEKIYAPRRS